MGAAVEAGRLRVFATFTLGPEARLMPAPAVWRLAAKVRAQAWERLDDRLGANAWAIEPHGDGTPHVHALLGRFVPEEVARRAWGKAGGGKVVRLQAAGTRHGGYLVKSLAEPLEGLPDRVHRYGGSREFSLRSLSEGERS